jgi:hypothetical protein
VVAPPESTAPYTVPEAAASTAPRPTLRSVDLEVLADVQQPPRRSTVPPPLPSRARRYRGPEATPRDAHPAIADQVFGALRDLVFFETPVEAASFCLVTAMLALPSLAGLALLRDEDRGGYVVVYARGPRSHAIVRTHVAEDDPLVAMALVRGGPVALEYGPDLAPPDRHAAFGDPWTGLLVPVQDEERCLGVLELVDPIDGAVLGEATRDALSTIARHLSDFVRGKATRVESAFAPEQVGLEE